MPERPTVSALVAAYNYERYVGRAIQSALDQDYPAELLEVVVVDDGSTDATAELVAELAARNPQREIRLVRQANGGLRAATNTPLAHARGEILAVLDADDVWLPSKTRRNVEMLADPQVGLVFSDMAIIDGEDRITHPSLFAWAWQDWRPPRGESFARLLAENFATASSIAMRASLREVFDPVPAEIAYCDWWFALSVARVARLDYADDALVLYRVHGANLTGGVSGAAALRERRKDLAFQRHCLRTLPLDSLHAQDALAVWKGVETKGHAALAAWGSAFAVLAEVDARAGSEADSLARAAEDAAQAGDDRAEALLALRALAADPYRAELRARLAGAARREALLAALPDPLAGSRPFVALADAEELLHDDGLLHAYARELAGATGVTLAIDATRLGPEQAAGELRALVERCGLHEREDIHLVAVLGDLHAGQRRRMLAGARAFYGSAPREDAALPSFTPQSLRGLRALAA